MKPKKPVKYYGVSLPLPFVEQIMKHIKNDDRYRNIPQFVKDACIEKMDKENYEELVKEGKAYDLDKLKNNYQIISQTAGNVMEKNPFAQLDKKVTRLLELVEEKDKDKKKKSEKNGFMG